MNTIDPIPARSSVIQAVDGRGGTALVRRETPRPGKNEVLIKMAAAPINPSDLVLLYNHSGSDRVYPCQAGREGAGIVVAAGTGILPRWLLGKRVAAAGSSDGAWGEYVIAKATACIPIRKDIPLEQASMLTVNPLTAFAMVRYARKHGHSAVINTAAGGPFGKMIRKHSAHFGIKSINLVRREEQAQQLLNQGEKFVLNTSAADFTHRLSTVSRQLNATLAFDAVGGILTGQILASMPPKSTILIYGNLSLTDPTISSFQVLTDDKKIEGFFLGNWTKAVGIPRLLWSLYAVQKHFHSDFTTEVGKRYRMSEIQAAIVHAQHNASEGKTLLIIDPDLAAA